MSYPKTAAERERARRAARERIFDRAAILAARYGWSLMCQAGNHARVDPDHGQVGCANDGTGCLCPCHDPKPEEVAP